MKKQKIKINSTASTIFAEKLIQTGVIGILAAALIYRATSIVLLCICALVLSLGAKAWARVSLNKMEQSLQLSTKRAFPNDPIQVKVHIRNKKIIPVWVRIEIEGGEGTLRPQSQLQNHSQTESESRTQMQSQPQFQTQSELQSQQELKAQFQDRLQPLSQETGLSSFGDYRHQWDLTYPKRGVYSLGPLRVSGGDLLGFYSVQKSDAQMREVIIYPELIPFSPGEIKSESLFGNHITRNFIEDPVLLAGTRDYTQSRPAKNIHWTASAKTGVLQEKVLESSAHKRVLLIVDVEGFKEADAFDEFEYTLSKAATATVELFKAGISPGLMVNGVLTGGGVQFVSADEGADTVYKQLEILARLTMDLDVKWNEMINAGPFKADTSYLYFCCSVNEKACTLKKRGKNIQFISGFRESESGASIDGVTE